MADETEVQDDGEYPKMLYKGDAVDKAGYDHSDLETITVADAAEEKAARGNGYGDLRSVGKKAEKAAS